MVMKNLQTIINIFKPTRTKIIAVFIFFVGINFLADLPSLFLNSSLLFPSFDCFCGQFQNYLDKNYLDSIPERIRLNSSPEEILEASDSWIPIFFFCILPLRIIYYYILSCLIIIAFGKLKMEKK